ncbi:MAG TPA: M23 family metallopeptidase [Kofleriaceae bacterium]|nr:M23 family metallopeptidase [Kofleriaceae bacterium]
MAAPADPASAALVAPVATDATTANALAMLGFARLAGAFELPFVPGLGEPIARAQVVMREFFHDLEDQMSDLVDDSGLSVHDLTMLTVEPVAHTESSGFGWRDDPIRHTRRFHSGTDFRGKPGTPVVAAGDGVVTFSGRMGGYGNMVEIDHGGGVITRYAHLRRIDTQKNAAITAGQQIGQVGSTGRATGPHLHFEVRLDGAPVSAITAMSVAALQRESPIAGRVAALALSPELQAHAESDVDPPKQHGHGQAAQPSHRPERAGRGKRKQVLW